MGIKRMLQNRRLSIIRNVQEQGAVPPRALPVRTVGLVLCLSDLSQLALLDKLYRFFSDRGAVCGVCIYQKNIKLQIPDMPGSRDWLVLHAKNVNWYGLILSGAADAFVQQRFDVLINVSPDYFFTTSHIAAVTRAKLKVGRYVRSLHPYQLILGGEQLVDGDDFIKLLEACLTFIKVA